MALRLKGDLEGGKIRVFVDLNETAVPFVAVAFELHVDAGMPGLVRCWAAWKRPNGQLDEGERTLVLTGAAVQERQAFPGPFQHPVSSYQWAISYIPGG